MLTVTNSEYDSGESSFLSFFFVGFFFFYFFYAEDILVYINDLFEIKMDGSMKQKLIQFP